MLRTPAACLLCFVLIACASVHQEDLEAWTGRPVSDLEKHPIFLTFPVVRTVASDGTEIRDYINSRNAVSCSSGGNVFSGTVNLATYNSYSSCMQNYAACHAIFYIKDGVVDHVSGAGTGGMRCMTDETFRPGFTGVA